MNPLTGLLASRKTWAALFATVLVLTPVIMDWSGSTKQERQSSIATATYAIAGIWGIKIASIAYEDGKRNAPPPPPPQQINVGGTVTNHPADPAPPPQPPPAAPLAPADPRPDNTPLTRDDFRAMFDTLFRAALKPYLRPLPPPAPAPPPPGPVPVEKIG